MIRATIFLCFLAIFALSAPVPAEGGEKVGILLQIIKFFKTLTEEETIGLKEVINDHKDGETSDDMFRALQAKSPTLYNKFLKLRTIIQDQINCLDEEAKPFVRSAFDNFVAILRFMNDVEKSKQQEIVDKVFGSYRKLSFRARGSIQDYFPHLKRVADSYISAYP